MTVPDAERPVDKAEYGSAAVSPEEPYVPTTPGAGEPPPPDPERREEPGLVEE